MPWLCTPHPCKRKQKDLTPQETEFLDKEVQRMLEMGTIAPSDRKDLILSSIYTVPKKDSTKRRPVINLRWVNSHIRRVHFKMSTMRDVKLALTQDCYMAKLDLKDCFWGLPLSKQDQRAVAFRWKGTNYVFKCLPFGLSLAPMFITKLYRHVVEYLQARGHRVMIYIDDLLILGENKQKCEDSLRATLELMKDLGAVVNEEKSCFSPEQTVNYLGFCLDSRTMTVTAPPNKIRNLKKQIRTLLRRKVASARDLASILGKINAMADALFPVRVHTSHLQELKLKILGRGLGWDQSQSITTNAIDDLTWWADNISLLNGRPINAPEASLQATTDASDYGWGATIKKINENSSRSWGGIFSKEISTKHINYKELLAILYLIKSSPIPLRGQTVDLGVDNTTALFYINNMGGRKQHLALLAEQIYAASQANHVKLIAYHLPGMSNHQADWESRKTRSLELVDFQLHPSLFKKIDRVFGPHSIDAFATYQNRQTPRFGTWEPQPEATWIDSMNQSWKEENVWANPPFSLIGRILHKIKKEKVTVTILAPLWPAQTWYPQLLAMSTEPPLLLPETNGVFIHPMAGSRTPRWPTLAWRVSGRPSRRRVFMKPPSTSWQRHGSRLLYEITKFTGGVGALSPERKEKTLLLLTTLLSLLG